MYNLIIDADWSTVLSSGDVGSACDSFYGILYDIFDVTVPRFGSGSSSKHYPPWFTGEIISKLKQKNSAHKKYLRFNSQYYYSKFKSLRSETGRLIERAYDDFMARSAEDIKSNPNKFWSFVKKKKGNSRIPGVMLDQSDDSTHSTPQHIVDAFASYFESVYVPSSGLCEYELPDAYVSASSIGVYQVSEKDIIDAIKSLKNKMLSGPDSVPCFIIKDCANILVTPLQYIFNLIIKSSTFPEIWKVSRGCPIHKKNEESIIQNYRQISIISNFAKIFEKVVYKYIYSQVKLIISPEQNGFVEGRSTVTNLVCFTQYVAEILDDKGQVDAVYTDISKAFDQIDHGILLSKLRTIGFSEPLVNLIRSYLVGRQQFVSFMNVRSYMFSPTSGVPQGSVLGPLLFLIYINDITSVISSMKLLLADDLRMFRAIRSLDDCLALQRDIDRVLDWSNRNNLKLNIGKCQIMSFTRRAEYIICDYEMNGAVLDRCSSIKDLGILFDQKLCFDLHVSAIVAGALRSLGFVYRNCRDFTSPAILKILYIAYVRSKLEYGSLVWYPIYSVHIDRIEKVQRKFLKFMAYLVDGVYPERGYSQELLLGRFDLLPLRVRRNVLAVKFVYGLLHGLIDSPWLIPKLKFCVPRLETRQRVVFYLNRPRTNVLSKSPVYVMCNLVNGISNLCDIFFHDVKCITDCVVDAAG